MGRRAFFSFHYQNDIWRVSTIRKSWVTKDKEVNTFVDSASWESIKKAGDAAIKRWINAQMKGTSVTIVLIGRETAYRKYVLYEIEQSVRLGKGLLGIYINGIKNSSGLVSLRGPNPFGEMWIVKESPYGPAFNRKNYLSNIYPTYDWVAGNGYKNMDSWIEAAAKAAGR